jgi:hypothetical protein
MSSHSFARAYIACALTITLCAYADNEDNRRPSWAHHFHSKPVTAQQQGQGESQAAVHKHVIGVWPHGFFSAFLGVLGNLAWAKANKRVPVVHWDNNSPFYEPSGHNGVTHNVWEYYFEQTSQESYVPGQDRPFGRYTDPQGGCVRPWVRHTQAFKEKMHAIIKEFVHIKKPVQEKIDAFYNKNMKGKVTIGIHIRGTDKSTEISMPTADELFIIANQVATLLNHNCQFLVASDEERYIKQAIEVLQGPVIFYDAHRSTNGKPIHRRPNKAECGEDVLVESVLLSRCDVFIHSHSNVAYGATFFNPHLVDILVDGCTEANPRQNPAWRTQEDEQILLD